MESSNRISLHSNRALQDLRGRADFLITKWNVSLFVLFSTYGPAVPFFGQFRYLEIFLVALIFLNLRSHLGATKERIKFLVYLFVLSGIIHLVSGLLNNSPNIAIISRFGTYLVLAALVVSIYRISRNNTSALIVIILGYSLSYVFILFVGTSTSSAYHLVPWRLGLGYAFTIGVTVFFVIFPKYLPLAPLALLATSGLHIFMDARTIGMSSALAAGLCFVAINYGRLRPKKFILRRLVWAIFVLIIVLYSGFTFFIYLAESGWLPDEVSSRTLAQNSHTLGFLVAARPDAAAAILAILMHPILGSGPGLVEPSVLIYYSTIAAEVLSSAGEINDSLAFEIQTNWELGTPSHSHILGAWADAGVVAAICWAYVIYLALRVLVVSTSFKNAWAPLFIFTAISTIFTVVFSPGPHRMDMAIKLVILIFALAQFSLGSSQSKIQQN